MKSPPEHILLSGQALPKPDAEILQTVSGESPDLNSSSVKFRGPAVEASVIRFSRIGAAITQLGRCGPVCTARFFPPDATQCALDHREIPVAVFDAQNHASRPLLFARILLQLADKRRPGLVT